MKRLALTIVLLSVLSMVLGVVVKRGPTNALATKSYHDNASNLPQHDLNDQTVDGNAINVTGGDVIPFLIPAGNMVTDTDLEYDRATGTLDLGGGNKNGNITLEEPSGDGGSIINIGLADGVTYTFDSTLDCTVAADGTANAPGSCPWTEAETSDHGQLDAASLNDDDHNQVYTREQLLWQGTVDTGAGATAGQCFKIVPAGGTGTAGCSVNTTQLALAREFDMTAIDITVTTSALTTTEGCKVDILKNAVSQATLFELGDSTSVAATQDADTASVGVNYVAGDTWGLQVNDPDADGCPDGSSCDCDGAVFDLFVSVYGLEVR